MKLQVESVLYEATVNALVDVVLEADPPGYLHLPDITFIVMENIEDRGKIASLAAQAVVMLAQERREHEQRALPAGGVSPGVVPESR